MGNRLASQDLFHVLLILFHVGILLAQAYNHPQLHGYMTLP